MNETPFIDALVGLASVHERFSRIAPALLAELGSEHIDAALGLLSLDRMIGRVLAAMLDTPVSSATDVLASWRREHLR